MAKLSRSINREELAKPDEFSVLPKGKYNCMVSGTDLKVSENGKEQIELKFKVMDGEYANRVITSYITQNQPLNENIDEETAKKNKRIAEEIGQKALNSLMMATDVTVLEDTDDFLNKQVVVELKVRPATENFAERNEVVRYSEYKGNVIPTQSKPQKQNNAWANVPKQPQTSESQNDVAPGARPW